MSVDPRLVDQVREHVRAVPEYPIPGVTFRDITPLLADPGTFQAVIEHLVERYRGQVDAIAGIEARGFVFAAPLAYALGVGNVLVRKKGKLPPPVIGAAYDLEYGTAEVEVSQAAVHEGARVLLVDDVLATGGTAAAAAGLLEEAGMTVTGVAVLMELASEFDGRAPLAGRDVHALVQY